MSRLKKTRRITLISITLLFVALFVLLMTRPGLYVTYRIAQLATPGKLTIDNMQGSLSRNMLFTHIHYQDDSNTVDIDKLALHWRFLPLLWGKLSINTLDIDHLSIQYRTMGSTSSASTTTDTTTDKDFYLPLHFAIGTLTINQLTLNNTAIDKLTLSAAGEDTSVKLANFSLQKGSTHLNTQGTIALKAPISVDLKTLITATTPGGKPLTGSINTKGDLQELHLTASTATPFVATLEATFTDVQQLGHVDLKGDWKKFDWQLANNNLIHSEQGQIHLTGKPNDYQFALDTDLSGRSIPNTQLSLEGEGSTKNVSVNKLLINTLNGTIKGAAEISWADQLAWTATFSATTLNPGIKWHDWPGDISFNLIASGEKGKTLNTKTIINNLTGKLRNFPVKGELHVNSQDKSIEFTQTYLQVDTAKMQIDGSVHDQWDINWTIDVPNLYVLFPYSSGTLETHGTITGAFKTPTIIASAIAKDWNIDKLQLKQLSLESHIDLLPEQTSKLHLDINALTYNKNVIDSIGVNISGTTEKHQINVNIADNNVSLNLHILGNYLPAAWTGQLDLLNVDITHHDRWRLLAPSTLTASSTAVTVSPITLASDEQRIVMKGHWEDNVSWQSAIDMSKLKLSHLSDFMPEGIAAVGEVSLNLNAEQASVDSFIHTTVTGALSEGSIEYHMNDKAQHISFLGGTLHASLLDDGLHSHFQLNLQKNTPVLFALDLPNFHLSQAENLQQSISGKLLFTLKTLDLLPSLSSEIDKAEGQLVSDLQFGGTLAAPTIGGSFKLNNGLISLPKYGITVNHINLTLTGTHSNLVNVTGTAKSGDGDIELDGKLGLSSENLVTQITLKGKDFMVMNTKEYVLVISPDMTFNYTPELLTLGGKLNIIKADITPKDFSSTETLPDNVTYRNLPKKKAELKFDGDLSIFVVNPIHFSMMGLDANILGNVNINFDPERSPLANGEFKVTDGSYQAYGQKLIIQKADIFYKNSLLTNPGISIRAIRTVKAISTGESTTSLSSKQSSDELQLGSSIKEIIVGIFVQGTPNNLRISLFSEPSGLSQSDILSYIMLGRPQNRIAGSQATLLLQALASSNSGSNVDHITEEIQQGFGLDELSIEDTPQLNPENNQAEDNTSVVVGKKLTESLSVQYSVGLLIPVNVLRLVYQMTSRLSAQIETSAVEDGADIFYTIERD